MLFRSSFKSGFDISVEVVMKKIQWVQYLIQGCDVMREVDDAASFISGTVYFFFFLLFSFI